MRLTNYWNEFPESDITDACDERVPLNVKNSRNSCPSDKYLEIPTRKSTPGILLFR